MGSDDLNLKTDSDDLNLKTDSDDLNLKMGSDDLNLKMGSDDLNLKMGSDDETIKVEEMTWLSRDHYKLTEMTCVCLTKEGHPQQDSAALKGRVRTAGRQHSVPLIKEL